MSLEERGESTDDEGFEIVPDNALDDSEKVSYKFVQTGKMAGLRKLCVAIRNFLTGKSTWPGLMVTHETWKFQKCGTNRSGTKQYWTCGEKPYCDCRARATTLIEEEDNPVPDNEPIKRHRLVSVSLPEVKRFLSAPSIIKVIISGSSEISSTEGGLIV